MPKESIGVTTYKLEELLLAVERQAAELPFLTQLAAELREALERIKRLQSRQAQLEALKQVTTRELQEAKVEGKDIAIRLRSGLRTYLGNQNERLAEFGVKPWRKRTRRKVSGETANASAKPRRARVRRSGTEK
jgi:hypothetical protein